MQATPRNPARRLDPAVLTLLYRLRHPGGPLAGIRYRYVRRRRWHEWSSPNGAELAVIASGIIEIRTATGQVITLDPSAGPNFTVPQVLRLLGAMQIIAPRAGGIRIE